MTLADKLRPHVAEIILAHEAGDESATQIMKFYRMHCDCPSDQGAPALCEAAFDKWIASRTSQEAQNG